MTDSLTNYVEDFNSTKKKNKNEYYNQKNICFDCNKDGLVNWSDRVNGYLSKSGYILSNKNNTCPKKGDKNVYPDDEFYILIRDTKIGDYDYCIYQKRYYEINETDDYFTKQRFSYKVVSYMKFDFPIVGDFIKLPIVSETKTIVNYKNL